MSRSLYLAAFAYLALCLFALRGSGADSSGAHPAQLAPAAGFAGTGGAQWFAGVKAMCNPVEVTVAMRRFPPPPGVEGSAYQAACYALAGRTDGARLVIESLPPGQRGHAADVVFEVGHPVADAGDDRAAGPIMSLVVEYRPDNYMALYHAGISEHMLGHREEAVRHLRAFLRLYPAEDGWRGRAEAVLGELGAAEGA